MTDRTLHQWLLALSDEDLERIIHQLQWWTDFSKTERAIVRALSQCATKTPDSPATAANRSASLLAEQLADDSYPYAEWEPEVFVPSSWSISRMLRQERYLVSRSV